MIGPIDLQIERFCIHMDMLRNDSQRVMWTQGDILGLTQAVWAAPVDTRPTCDRCKQHQDNTVIGFDGEYCPACYLEIYSRWAKHHEISGLKISKPIINDIPISICSAGRNDITGYANGDSIARNC